MKKSLINVQADPSILANLTIEGLARPGEAVDRNHDVLVNKTDLSQHGGASWGGRVMNAFPLLHDYTFIAGFLAAA